MVFNVHRNHKVYQGRGEGVGYGEGGRLRWAAMRAILMFH